MDTILHIPSALRRPPAAEQAALEALWAASQDVDEPLSRPTGGWWSLTAWATTWRLLVEDETIIGVTAVAVMAAPPMIEARLALMPAMRNPERAATLVRWVLDLAAAAGQRTVQLALPTAAHWAIAAARAHGFVHLRSQLLMLRPGTADRRAPPPPRPDLQIRSVTPAEVPALLMALNTAWADTWQYRPLAAADVIADLAPYPGSMLGAFTTAAPAELIGTCHAQFDAQRRNPDGHPYAWIANLTTVPQWRGRGVGRALLLHGMARLTDQGAQSIALSVDGGATVPVTLYQSLGFQGISSLGRWEWVGAHR